MDGKEAIETIRQNYPPEQYTMLRDALEIAVAAVSEVEELRTFKETVSKSLQRPNCSIEGLTMYVTKDIKYLVENFWILRDELIKATAKSRYYEDGLGKGVCSWSNLGGHERMRKESEAEKELSRRYPSIYIAED
jgi:hypothetical protein